MIKQLQTNFVTHCPASATGRQSTALVLPDDSTNLDDEGTTGIPPQGRPELGAHQVQRTNPQELLHPNDEGLSCEMAEDPQQGYSDFSGW